ncbi:cation-transporting P-type ATPase, partial [Burkholderia cenocepacia]
MNTLAEPAVTPDPAPAATADALSADERRTITRQIALALLAGGLLVLSFAWRALSSGSDTLAQLLAALASLIVAGPVFAS